MIYSPSKLTPFEQFKAHTNHAVYHRYLLIGCTYADDNDNNRRPSRTNQLLYPGPCTCTQGNIMMASQCDYNITSPYPSSQNEDVHFIWIYSQCFLETKLISHFSIFFWPANILACLTKAPRLDVGLGVLCSQSIFNLSSDMLSIVIKLLFLEISFRSKHVKSCYIMDICFY